MKNKIAGYIVVSKGRTNGFCTLVRKRDKGVLWLGGGTGFMCALFKTEEAAQIAIDRTEGYALNEGMTPSSHPLWFGHDILPVKQA